MKAYIRAALFRPLLKGVCTLLLLTASGFSQTVSSSLLGILTDPADAVIPRAEVILTNEVSGAVSTTQSNNLGLFRFLNLLPGSYSLTVRASGFKTYTQKGIKISASETRDLGKIMLELGSLTEEISVSAELTPIQTASSEKSSLVTGTQLNSLALKGRDFFALMRLVPGVIDTGAQSRDATSPNANQGIFINGGRSDMKNITVDGITDLDTGSNNTLHYQPNMDAIAEVRILTSNYQAEYGRSGSGLISVITKSGTREFHGSGWWTHRHEQFNANNFFRNRVGLPRTPYRYNIAGFSLGGPIYIPNRFNADKSKLFFFASQEYTRQMVDWGTQFRNMPTEAERRGDFSHSFDTNGQLIPVKDPLTGRPFPGNIIPADRIDPLGQAILKFFPLPNYVDPDPRLLYRQNYKASASGAHPRRNDTVRIDLYPSQKLTSYFRWINDADDSDYPFQGFDYAYTILKHPNPGHGYAWRTTYTLRPTLLNEFNLGKSWNSWQWAPKFPEHVKRSVIGDIPQWFPNELTTRIPSEALDAQMIPNISFGGIPVNPPSVSVNNIQHVNHNDTWDITDNLSWVAGAHSVKAGVYLNFTDKVQIHGDRWNGVFSFATAAANPYDSGHAYANALLGNFKSYTESTRGINFHATYWTAEFYVQDNWRVNRQLTLDYGVRFYHLEPQVDRNYTLAVFDPETYDLRKAPRLYTPARDARGTRVAYDPVTGTTAHAAIIGKYVPGSGDFANGMNVAGKNGYPWGAFTVRALSAAPRFGFAYDVSGKASTVIRGGFGVFLDRYRQLINVNTVTNPPVSFAPTLYYGNLKTFAQAAGVLGPSLVRFPFPARNAKQPSVTNFSLGIQQRLPLQMVIDASYVGSLSRHLLQARNINPIPLFSRFEPKNQDPTSPGKPLPDDFFRPYAGHSTLTTYEFASSSNYHSLQVAVRRGFRQGLELGLSYTWSKVLGVASTYSESVNPYFSPRHWDYGPLSFDRSHAFVASYTYGLPKPGRKLKNRWVAAILDDWSISGITTFMSGAPFTPGFSTTYTTDITGSDLGARIVVLGDPKLRKSEKSFYRNFRTEVFALPAVGTFGNAGVGILRGPGVNNWDISLKKRIPLGLGEARGLEFRAESYNTFNHTQFNALDSAARFDATGKQVNANFGAFTGAAAPRIMSFALRLVF